MNENQLHLASLGVSTPKIDHLLKVIQDDVWGAKITGAGGGGCVVSLPKHGREDRLKNKIHEAGCRMLPTRLNSAGAALLEEKCV